MKRRTAKLWCACTTDVHVLKLSVPLGRYPYRESTVNTVEVKSLKKCRWSESTLF